MYNQVFSSIQKNQFSLAFDRFSEALNETAWIADSYNFSRRWNADQIKTSQPLQQSLNKVWSDAKTVEECEGEMGQSLYENIANTLKKMGFYVKMLQANAEAELPKKSDNKPDYWYSESDLTAIRSTFSLYTTSLSDHLRQVQMLLQSLQQSYQTYLKFLSNLQDAYNASQKAVVIRIK